MKKVLLSLSLALYALSSAAATLSPVQLLNPAGSTSGQAIVSTGASTAPAWGNVTATALAAQAANTVLANVTGSSASPTAVAVPSCSASGNNLQWTSGAGFTCATGYAQLASPTFTGSVTIPGGSITNTSISGSTGSFTTLAASSTITPTYPAGVVGNKTGGNVTAGSVGEYVNSTIPSGSPVSLTNASPANITSISLTAGDWDVWGQVVPVPSGTTTITQARGAITTTSAAIGNYGDVGSSLLSATQPANSASIVTIVPMRLNLASTTTVFLVGQVSFSGGTCTEFGFITARRR